MQFDNTEYPLWDVGKGYRIRGATATVCLALDGSVTLLYKGRSLAFRALQQSEAPIGDSEREVATVAGSASTSKATTKPALEASC